MKIRMLVSLAGPEYALDAGQETDRFDDAEARRLIEAGYAVPVPEKRVERAVPRAIKETRRSKG